MIGLFIRRPMLLLLGSCLALGAVTGFELTVLRRDGPELDATSLPVSERSVPALKSGSTGPVASTPEQQRQWIAAMLARPLFAADRRPQAAPKAAARAVAVLPRLTGVLIYGGSRRALFAGVDGAKPVSAAEGAEIADFKVQKIEAGQVTLVGPDGTRVVRPAFDPRSATRSAGVPDAVSSGTSVSVAQHSAPVSGPGRPTVSAR